jgi:hypothetical protein
MNENENEDEIILREVKVKPYGSHGIIAANPDDCPYRGEDSCISSNGMSICGSLYEDDYNIEPGHVTIRCMEELFIPDLNG